MFDIGYVLTVLLHTRS